MLKKLKEVKQSVKKQIGEKGILSHGTHWAKTNDGVVPGIGSDSVLPVDKGRCVLLHGFLYADIIEAWDLPNLDNGWFRRAKDISDPFVVVETYTEGKRSTTLAKTCVIDNNLNPRWNERFIADVCHEVEFIRVTVKDMDLVTADFIGSVQIQADSLLSEKPKEDIYILADRDGKPAGRIKVGLRYCSHQSKKNLNEVKENVFQMREGCRVTLYQDAHTPAELPVTQVISPVGASYQPRQLWQDISQSIHEAQKLIYIVGWSVNPNIMLHRDGSNTETLGELLKKKAEQGVRVLIMVWNEFLSGGMYQKGLMNTHDEETKIYFQNSQVKVFLAQRNKSKGKLLEFAFVATCYSHHQKCVILDAPIAGETRRRIKSFVGGIDLTDGRWDTPEHPLYRTLDSHHQHDFYNNCCASSVNVGPRQPWHDIHALVEGRVALDILDNFTQRWIKQAEDKQSWLLPINDEEFMHDWKVPKKEAWNVQFFRSINADSATFNGQSIFHLHSKMGRVFENSIQKAYIQQIRRAKNFIYIENQYFMGSSHAWLVSDGKCPHLIPVELTMRIIRAIKADENFRVYIVLPMYPEGDPKTAAMQEILHWQNRTMEMMYQMIARAIQDKRSEALPTDYLTFFCLGKKESRSHLPPFLKPPEVNTLADKVRQSMRFMIYVHSKMAIFDDEYIIVGSANINERSMSGNRDSEMAIGAYQPDFTKEVCGDSIPGNVRTFRLALWAEHCGFHSKEQLYPSAASCMTFLRTLGERNLQNYLLDEPAVADSHLLLYPVAVTNDGTVNARFDCPDFPDVGGSVLGKKSEFIPNSLTT